MTRFHLTKEQERLLRAQLCSTDDVDLYRRTVALLEIGQGRCATEIANALGVSCSSVYNWLNAFEANPKPAALVDQRGQGRPSLWSDSLQNLLRSALAQAPDALGYQVTDWTVPLLQEHLCRQSGKRLSTLTIRRKLHQWGYVWKEFGYVLTGKSVFNGKISDSLAGQVTALPLNGDTVAQYQ
jgi:transposase